MPTPLPAASARFTCNANFLIIFGPPFKFFSIIYLISVKCKRNFYFLYYSYITERMDVFLPVGYFPRPGARRALMAALA